MKIIASDYDGTLNMRGVSEENKAAIKEWQAKGNLFGLVSGRALKDAVLLAQRDGIRYDFYIAATGATIANSDGEILKRTTFSIDTVKKLAKLVEEKGCKHLVFVCDHERKWLFFEMFIIYIKGKGNKNCRIQPRVVTPNQFGITNKKPPETL